MATSPALTPKVLLNAILRMVIGVPVIALIVILPAGRWDYWQGWLFLAALFVPMLITLVFLVKNDPALLERRMRMREQESAQRKVIGLTALYFLALFILPGLDVRYGWSNVPAWVSVLGSALVCAGYLSMVWVMAANRYLSRVVEVAEEQQVISSGPYAVVRHPMYLGMCLLAMATPLALGSYWIVLLALLIVPLLAARLLNEEQVLRRDLPGYLEYTHKVKYRLIPGIW